MDIVGAFNQSQKESWTIAGSVAGAVCREIGGNAKFYLDAAKFNLMNGFEPTYEEQRVCFSDPPHRVRSQLSRLMKKFTSTQEVFRKLNIPREVVKYSPLEAMWAFRYKKKYNTGDYKTSYVVLDAEILTPLTESERVEFSDLF